MVALVACSSEPTPSSGEADFCGAAKSANVTCKEPSPCDTALASACTTLAEIVAPSTLAAAKGCLESGICGVASCVSRAQKSAAPSDMHKQLASNFCNTCAGAAEGCEAGFYRKGTKSPGLLVLPFTAKVAEAVDAECTGTDGCQAQFTTCATDVIARVAGEVLDPEAAACAAEVFRKDEGEQPVGPNGKPQGVTCTPSNCLGCCRDDKCEAGDLDNACGVGAGACEVCSGAAKCTAGKCKEPCGPNNCDGCCDGDTCVPGTAKDKCGGKGGSCASCAGSFVCSNKTCIDASCQATCTNGCCSATGCKPGTAANACGTGGEACVDCGVGRSCQNAACVLDRTSLWDVYISFAVVPETKKTGEAWDPLNGAPDPFLKVFTSEGASVHSGQTSVLADSTVPFWAETPIKRVKASELLANTSIEVWDSDVDFDDFIGGCKLPLTPAIFDGSLQDFTCPATASGVSVKVYFRINPSP